MTCKIGGSTDREGKQGRRRATPGSQNGALFHAFSLQNFPIFGKYRVNICLSKNIFFLRTHKFVFEIWQIFTSIKGQYIEHVHHLYSIDIGR